MSRTLSAEFIGAAFGQETDKALIVLMTVTHPDLAAGDIVGMPAGPIRVSNHPTTRYSSDPLRYGTTSRGQQYTFYPFSTTLPEEGEDAQPTMQIVLDIVERQVTALLASVITPPKVTIELVLSSDPDTVEIEFPDFDLVSSMVDVYQAVLSLSLDSMVTEPYPGYDFTPSATGGLWASA